ncbi:monovalent cation/H(+) antiporter subunit G [uncultured Arthrobacter sp.]|uniref:monovalent cation/H(+) antiporter subunit G n=1 Tax=uncultured Arthrobacter sp. TaxID=114050 RepID=UPI002606E473|nr:monovalent cation/H(+) antiporter subunit G [uncultured Arthrobacter sp.]
MLTDVVMSILLIGGALMSLAAGIGLVRFPDLLSRMHAATKPQVLGLLLFLLALALETGSWPLIPLLVLCWFFQLLTTPVSAHMVGRAGYRTRHLRQDLLTIDELDDVVACAVVEVDRDDPAHEAEGVDGRQDADRRDVPDH